MARAPVVNLNLRIPPDLHKTLADFAAMSKPKKSLNNLIVEILYQAVRQSLLEEMYRRDPERTGEMLKRELAKYGELEERLAALEKKVAGEK